jgi:hypothetical protein
MTINGRSGAKSGDHTHKFPLTAADVAGQIWLLPVHEAVARAKMPLLWINPVTGQIATAYETRTVGETVQNITSLAATTAPQTPGASANCPMTVMTQAWVSSPAFASSVTGPTSITLRYSLRFG